MKQLVGGLGRPPRVFAPKLRSIILRPATNGITVTHEFHVGEPRNFVFTQPALMSAHVAKVIKQWKLR